MIILTAVLAVFGASSTFADDFKINVTDPAQLAWIEKARVDYNTSNPQNQLADAQAYFEWLASGWFASGAIQKTAAEIDAAVEKAKAGDATDLAAIAAALPKKP